jgi:ring-1,2-phenylacetyl-CoA epoxidase subunit PaaD
LLSKYIKNNMTDLSLIDLEKVQALVAQVEDPEIPVLTIADLGILRGVAIAENGTIQVTITPTYSGCPAMGAIEVGVKSVLQDAGYERFEVILVLSPAWTTDWLTQSGREKLLAYGIAPPVGNASKSTLLGERVTVACPQCGSSNTHVISDFGSTSCKALWRCKSCLEPFDYFKCH